MSTPYRELTNLPNMLYSDRDFPSVDFMRISAVGAVMAQLTEDQVEEIVQKVTDRVSERIVQLFLAATK